MQGCVISTSRRLECCENTEEKCSETGGIRVRLVVRQRAEDFIRNDNFDNHHSKIGTFTALGTSFASSDMQEACDVATPGDQPKVNMQTVPFSVIEHLAAGFACCS